MRTAFAFPLLAFATAGVVFATSCSDSSNTTSSSTGGHTSSSSASNGSGGSGASSSTSTSTASHMGGAPPDASIKGPCELPGSIQYFDNGNVHVVPGGEPTCQGAAQTGVCQGDLSFLKLPGGFCAHYYGHVGNARQLRFAPGGELFVASPTTLTTGGGSGGKSAILVLPDDDKDGYGDKNITFLSGLPSTQGLLFANDHFYYQDDTLIRKMAYAPGQRHAQSQGAVVADITFYTSGLHWPKVLDIADDGTIYVGNGGDQGEQCQSQHPFHGGILKLDGSIGGAEVAKGFRNPIAIRCARGKNRCFAAELAKDFSSDEGGREKIVPIRQGDDWGFPCCATKGTPYQSVGPNPNCGGVTQDTDSFFIGDTPFGIAFQSQTAPWPAPWNDKAIIVLHGAAGSWTGARVVAIDVDPDTGLLKSGTNIHGHNDEGALESFATGWDDNSLAHGRPAAADFSDDGRLFIANDNNGDIFWVAPLSF
ncbi:MAG TPA: hypothetical protein VHB21_19250 [Minicystis sp.]|nr:hypothetical protein [Minicystis sp.]